jgi:uncharacterized membrane protein YeaQ/YmgE (transglycosylase-associated protein family)
MGLIVALIIGGIIGWLASIVMRTNGQQGILLAIVNLFRRGSVR